ncbi:hypothetical protein ACTMTJ_07930 [Phytohabitans sp. LJ34]|uniref:hypothetical protein n=1 Tax=Phytohabitans sp. LJ34 TaxID=3452217 RepID=UPI003F89E181
MRGTTGRTTGSGRATRRGRPHPHDSRYRQGFVLGLSVGMSLALVLAVVAFVLTRPQTSPPASTTAAATTANSDAGHQQQAKAAIAITARHLGNLRVQIDAQVTAPVSYDPISMGQVVAYTDMVEMPMSHRKGPIVMAELGNRKGTYQAVTTLSMIGEYDIMVEVKQPMASTAHERLAIKSLSAGTG